MNDHYANITLHGPSQSDIVNALNQLREVTYVSPTVRECTVIFQSDLASQEDVAAATSRTFTCPALLVMGYASSIMMYHLYEAGERTDSYVSSPHEELELEGDAPPGNAERLCAAFGMERQARRVERILSKEASPTHAYAMAANRHGELCQALGLPQFAAGASFGLIEIGELPEGRGFELSQLIRTGG
jgi:hypothetical protein